MWAESAVFYQIYPLGLCGAPWENDGKVVHRLERIEQWIPHITRLGANAVYLSPVFESDSHGYDTRDYRAVDCRLGGNEDLRRLIDQMHAQGIRVVLDAVFNHVGRGFWAFRDVQEKKWDSAYKDWFYVNFGGDSAWHDGFWYEGWEGHYELVKLNLRNPAVADYLIDTVRFWIDAWTSPTVWSRISFGGCGSLPTGAGGISSSSARRCTATTTAGWATPCCTA